MRASFCIALLWCGGASSDGGQEAAPAVAPVAAPAAKVWRVEPIRDAAGGSTVPDAARAKESFAALLAADGMRVVAPDGKVRLEVWWRAELPLLPQAADGNFTLGRIEPGAFVGVARAVTGAHDYRDQAIDAGVYGLRYVHQPSDGNHLGTSDSRDFLVLTSLAEEQSPEAVTTKEALLALSVPVSPSDHALVLYVTAASEPAPPDGQPRIAQRGELAEQALEVALLGRAAGAAPTDPPEPLRLALVIDGHTGH
ncbi:MAG: hypothetical protein FJ293_00910 [Planctomycetes bacterium]|nr:hypothetical protein [Planctomycetota bacterium]